MKARHGPSSYIDAHAMITQHFGHGLLLESQSQVLLEMRYCEHAAVHDRSTTQHLEHGPRFENQLQILRMTRYYEHAAFHDRSMTQHCEPELSAP